MALKNIVAIIQSTKQNQVINTLQKAGIPGASVMPVKGYGEYINQFSHDSLSNGIRLEVIADEEYVDEIVAIIMDNACTGQPGDGVVTVFNIDTVYRIKDKLKIS